MTTNKTKNIKQTYNNESELFYSKDVRTIKELIEALKEFQKICWEDCVVKVQNQDWGGSYNWTSEIFMKFDKKYWILIL